MVVLTIQIFYVEDINDDNGVNNSSWNGAVMGREVLIKDIWMKSKKVAMFVSWYKGLRVERLKDKGQQKEIIIK